MLYSRYSYQFYSFLEFSASPFYNDIQKNRNIQHKCYKYDMREKHTNMKHGGLDRGHNFNNFPNKQHKLKKKNKQ